MTKKIEIEKKYYCKNPDELIQLLEKKNMRKLKVEKESDEYFTDLESEYIKNRTCLRLRLTDKNLILTFKGKSSEFGNTYAKVETELKLNRTMYNTIYELLLSLGFCSYVTVNKKRLTYTKKEDSFVFNVMIDMVDDIGCFAEFELLCFEKQYDIEELKLKLNQFMQSFKNLNLIHADLPYRDFVAEEVYHNIKIKGNLRALLVDFDGTLVDTERIFFNSFKNVLDNNYNVNITFDDYKEYELDRNAKLLDYLKKNKKISLNESNEKIMDLVYFEYKKQLSSSIVLTEEIMNFKLIVKLKELGVKVGLVSTSKREYIDIILKKLEVEDLFDVIISRDDVSNFKPHPEAYLLAIDRLNISSEECLAVEDSKRGIRSAMAANIKTVKVNGFTNDNESFDSVAKIDKVGRLILILLNHL